MERTLQWSGENSQLQQHKIRVVYLPPDGQTVPEEEESHLYAPSVRLTHRPILHSNINVV